MKIVLDTNVLVSGLLSPYGPAGEIVRLVSAGVLHVLYDARIFLEYRDVLSRPKFQFDMQQVNPFLDFMQQTGQVVAGAPLTQRLPDPDDEPFLEIALAAHAACLITGNKKHFPKPARQNTPVFSPSEFIEFFRTHHPEINEG
ncbi:MAG: putative toxin-antitoxin system toxin component, PIN family [Thermodesulfobacteriota bacterium]|nr:putative toxin-antitoxin system toxin component, PIN family [Thermodesulfobacteriota bacterium]